MVPHRATIVLGEILIFDFLEYKHVLRPQDSKKPVFKKSLYVCVCACTYVRMYVTGDISDALWYWDLIFFSKFFSPKNVEVLFFFFNLDVIPHLFTRKYLYLKIWFLLDISNLTIFLKFFSQNFCHKKIQKTKFFFSLDVVPNLCLWEY